MTEGALTGLRILDASQGVAGPFAARLLGDLGAHVIKIEPPEGDSARRMHPAQTSDPDPTSFFAYLNWNKRGIVTDLASQDGRTRFAQLAATADVLIESGEPGQLATLGLGYDELARTNPGLVLVSVTPYGQDGPRDRWQHTEATDWATSGYQYFAGDPQREPLMLPGAQAEFHTAQAVALAALAALHERDRSGRGQPIDISIQEASLTTHAWNAVSWTHAGHVLRRLGSDVFRCADGWVFWMRRGQETNLFALIERPDLFDDPRLEEMEIWRDIDSDLWDIVRAWCAEQPMLEVYRRAQELRIAVTPVNTVADLLASEQLAERDWFVTPPDTSEDIRYPGPPFGMTDTPTTVQRPAPTLDEHADEILAELATSSQPAAPPATPAPATSDDSLPFEGLRVVEVTANWAGPIAGRHLGDLGAEVIKVEHHLRPATRALWYPGNEPGLRPYNRAGYFNNLNRSKLDVSLDLSTERGRELFLQLIERADVLIENNSARVMPNLGLGWDTLSQRNPRLIMASISGFGASGPERDYVAYGANIEASSGLAAGTGYHDDDTPYRANTFYADPITGNYATIAILAALRARETSGIGQWLDLSLNECAASFFGDAFLEYQRTGQIPPRRGNRHPIHAPQGAYQTTGDDDWLVLTVRDEADWHALCTLLDRDDWRSDPTLATPEGRHARHDEIDAAITAWTAPLDHREAAQLLQDAGLPAAPVYANYELVTDSHLHQRQFYIPIDHPEAGVLPFAGFPWKFGRTPAQVRRPAPRFAEHNNHVFGTLLGLTPVDIAQLEADAVTARVPVTGPVIRVTN
jgi:crotonobetainyl-CoA:carnitine CoA-transferase CaiB-like acyl-CoA transferase